MFRHSWTIACREHRRTLRISEGHQLFTGKFPSFGKCLGRKSELIFQGHRPLFTLKTLTPCNSARHFSNTSLSDFSIINNCTAEHKNEQKPQFYKYIHQPQSNPSAQTWLDRLSWQAFLNHCLQWTSKNITVIARIPTHPNSRFNFKL